MERKGFMTRSVRQLMPARWICTLLLAVMPIMRAAGQFSGDFMMTAAVTKGANNLGTKYSQGSAEKMKTQAMEDAIALEMNGIRQWQRKESEYLKDTQGFAQAIVAGSTLYTTAVKTLRNLNDLRRAAERNPQGIVTSAVMNNLYVEMLTELVKTYRMVNYAVKTGGSYNMLTGKERAEMLWLLVDRFEELNAKIHELTMSVYYWNFDLALFEITAAFGVHDMKSIADGAHERWKRCYEAQKESMK